jgi:hypothetical protein
VRKFIISLTSLALAAGMLVGAPAPVRAAAPANDNFADRAEIVSSTTIDIMTLEEATDQDLDALDICGLDPTNLWDPEGTECHEGSSENDYYNSRWWFHDTTEGNAYRVTLEVPLCIAEVRGDYLVDGPGGDILYPYPYGSHIRMAVYGGPQGAGTTHLDLANTASFNWSYEGLVIALEVRATGDEMPILIGFFSPFEGAPSEGDWADYEACGDDEDSLTLTVTDITSTAPANDLVEDATVLNLGDLIDIDLSDATSSYSDPSHYSSEYGPDWPTAVNSVRSAWYTWTAPATKTYAFDTVGSDCIYLSDAAFFFERCGDTVLAIFEDIEGDLEEVDSNDDCDAYDGTDDLSTRIYEDYLSCLELDATEGTEYYFMVASYYHGNEYVNIHVGFEEATIPVNTVAPRLLNSNVLRAGRTVSVNNGVWSGGTISYDYAWYACKRRVSKRASVARMLGICTQITGADTTSFTPTRAQARQFRNRHLLVQVTASNGEGETDALTGTSRATMR